MQIEIRVLNISGGAVKIGITAPMSVKILRDDIKNKEAPL